MKILKYFFFTILFTLLIKELTNLIFQIKMESRVYNTGAYFLSQTPLSNNYNFDSLFTPYHLYLLNYRPTPENFVRYFENVRFLSYGLIFLFFSYNYDYYWGVVMGLIYSISPFTLIQKTWIAFSDTYTFFFSLLLILLFKWNMDKKLNYKNNIYFYAIFIVVVSLGLNNHFFQFLFITLMIILIQTYFDKNIKLFFINFLSLFVLAIIIRFSSYLIFYINQLNINDFRVNIVKSLTVNEIINNNFINLFKGLYGFLFGLWGIFIYDCIFKKNYIHIINLIYSFIITCFTYDTTRVFTLIFFPTFFFALALNIKNYSPIDKKFTIFLLFISILIFFFTPLYYKWGERIIYLK
jgi:hypothetical protein